MGRVRPGRGVQGPVELRERRVRCRRRRRSRVDPALPVDDGARWSSRRAERESQRLHAALLHDRRADDRWHLERPPHGVGPGPGDGLTDGHAGARCQLHDEAVLARPQETLADQRPVISGRDAGEALRGAVAHPGNRANQVEPGRHVGDQVAEDQVDLCGPLLQGPTLLLGHEPAHRPCRHPGDRDQDDQAGEREAPHPAGATHDRRTVGAIGASSSQSSTAPRRCHPRRADPSVLGASAYALSDAMQQ